MPVGINDGVYRSGNPLKLMIVYNTNNSKRHRQQLKKLPSFADKKTRSLYLSFFTAARAARNSVFFYHSLVLAMIKTLVKYVFYKYDMLQACFNLNNYYVYFISTPRKTIYKYIDRLKTSTFSNLYFKMHLMFTANILSYFLQSLLLC